MFSYCGYNIDMKNIDYTFDEMMREAITAVWPDFLAKKRHG